MNEQEKLRGYTVLYKGIKRFVDADPEKFKTIQRDYPNIEIKIFGAKPFYNENSVGLVPISKLTLITE